MKKIDSVFIYTSTCCGVPATKQPCVIEKGQRVGVYLGARPKGEGSLGSWRCPDCRKPCTVTRSLNKETVTATGSVGLMLGTI